MTREECKALLAKKALLMTEHNGTSILDGDATLEIIDQIFDDFEKQLKKSIEPKTCEGCKALPFILTELTKKNGGKCGICKRYLKDNYEAESKDNA